MSRENGAGRDQRPPAARFTEIEAALDMRVLSALAAAWGMAKDRQLIAGHYITRAGVAALAAELAEPIGGSQAAEVIEAQKAIVAAARRLAAEGVIAFGAGGDDEYV